MEKQTDRSTVKQMLADLFLSPRAMDRLVSMDTGLKQHKTILLLRHAYVCVYIIVGLRVCVCVCISKRICVTLKVFHRLWSGCCQVNQSSAEHNFQKMMLKANTSENCFKIAERHLTLLLTMIQWTTQDNCTHWKQCLLGTVRDFLGWDNHGL